jgi:hypothetical protein
MNAGNDNPLDLSVVDAAVGRALAHRVHVLSVDDSIEMHNRISQIEITQRNTHEPIPPAVMPCNPYPLGWLTPQWLSLQVY